MATLKQRFLKWKETRKGWQKAGDVLFWLLLVLLIIPGPRKFIATSVNRIFLNIRYPGTARAENQARLTARDFQWNITDKLENQISLSDFSGEVIFLNFWATWCPPCIAELPEIQKLYNKYGNRVTFLLVTNEDPERVKSFMSKYHYELPVYYNSGTIPDILRTKAIPTTYIISPDGRIVTKKSGAVNWNSRATGKIFEELLDQAVLR
ncbi:MAG: TlpA family protein disulfide reductase [Bacteroidales bacterium]|nr:TlpA family protein disulfide reductase [Bacteroidales bacterium]